MIDKARAKAAGVVGEYIYPCPPDRSLLEFLEVSPEAFYDAVQVSNDLEILEWIRQKAKPRTQVEIKAWNQVFP
jgi:hypothetical protein